MLYFSILNWLITFFCIMTFNLPFATVIFCLILVNQILLVIWWFDFKHKVNYPAADTQTMWLTSKSGQK